MDRTPASLDFAVIGHQDSWPHIAEFVNGIRSDGEKLLPEKIKEIFPFLPPTDLFRVKVRSATGAEINGVYIETFIDPDKLDPKFIRTNINKVRMAANHAKKMGAKIVGLGGFTSIVLEGRLDELSSPDTKFTTGNTLTAAYIVKAVEKAAGENDLDLRQATVLIAGATGDIGMACVEYLRHRVKKVLLNARNIQRLEKLAAQLNDENVEVEYSADIATITPQADIIISVTSSTGTQLDNCKRDVVVCDAGYPKNLEENGSTPMLSNLFHGGMGQVRGGFFFNPDYSGSMYKYPVPSVSHGCVLEAILLAFENRFEEYSTGKGNITVAHMDEIYGLSLKHGITLAPFYNAAGVWKRPIPV